MQKFSLLTFACCLMLLFTACKKETLLETNQDLNPKTNLTNEQSSTAAFSAIKEVMDAAFDDDDSVAVSSLLLKPNKNIAMETATACFGSITGICGTPLIYNSCYYKYQIWNDPNNLYVDLYFPSSVIGWRSDCNGRRCQYYITPAISLNLFNSNGVKIGTVNVASSTITVSETRITFNINNLKQQYPELSCVKLSGQFYIMKRCSNCSATRVSTVCITPQQFCLQQCPSSCPTAGDIRVDNTTLCGSGTVNASLAINGNAANATTTWTIEGQVFRGNSVVIPFALNTSCEPQLKVVNVKSVCTATQEVLKETSFEVTVNPAVSSSVNTDSYECASVIEFSCPNYLISDISWTIGSVSGRGLVVPITSTPQVLNYSYAAFGCTFTGTQDNVYCLPGLKHQSGTSKQ